jgi:hypothetical protein
MQAERRWLFIFPYKRQGDTKSWSAHRVHIRRVSPEQPTRPTPIYEEAGDDWRVYIEMASKASTDDAQEEQFDETLTAAEQLADQCFKEQHPEETLPDNLESWQLPT